jgi:dTDP-4-dehydrorhamnose reductase
MSQLEIWGGLECTINRVKDNYLDQLDFSGHYLRNNDIEEITGLGIKALRYPILWERHLPSQDKKIDWTHTERNLNKLRENNITVIAGLVHHGSGPSYCSILDNFAEGLGDYAKITSEKFPWINYYTPVNEPFTTARFCGLYGFWYPHAKKEFTFAQILLNECKGIVLAMKEIRKVNPAAKLVQTEDITKVYSTPELAYQADYENARRWLSLDILCGRLTPVHPFWNYLLRLGIDKKDLFFFLENPCTPDIMGMNYYLTSERFLDHNISNYPVWTHGGNTRHAYADVEAIRVCMDKDPVPHERIKELWERYHLPIAITEVHLNCTREEQLRWLKEIWDTAQKLRTENIDIRAVTSWALLSSRGWSDLLTSDNPLYEVGAFDTRSSKLRPTAIAKMIKSLAVNGNYEHPLLSNTGWWKKESRLLYFSKDATKKINNVPTVKDPKQKRSKPLLIVGKTGTLGQAFSKICGIRGIDFCLLDRNEMNICDPVQVEKVIKEKDPWAIVNTAGFVRIDDAETEVEKCFLSNVKGPEYLALACRQREIKFLHFSSDLVFDGNKREPYMEKDQIAPLNIYGKSKAMGEQKVLESDPSALIIRTSAFFGPWDQFNFIYLSLRSLLKNIPVYTAEDVVISPTYVPDLVNNSLDLMIDDEKGIWHIANKGEISWAQFALEIAARAKLDRKLVIPLPLDQLNLKAPRPRYSVLHTEKGILLPSLENAIERYFSEGEKVYM